jgi:hypothetical protein
MKTKILAGLLLAGSAAFAAPRVSFGIGIGAPAPVVVSAPPCPGPGYVFVNGYWQLGPGYWHDGYRRAPVVRYERGRFDRDHFRR